MRFRVDRLLLFAAGLCAAAPQSYNYAVLAPEPGPWPAILGSVGLQRKPAPEAGIFVLRGGATASPEWATRVAEGAYLVLEGDSSLAEMFGFVRGKENVRAVSVQDVHQPELSIVWEKVLELPRYRIPASAQVFARERWSGAPLMAGFRHGKGGVLWMAVPPGERGYERFPYIIQALTDLGMPVPFHSQRLWAFFDYSYRMRVDVDYFAARWRKAGIAGLHIAAWHFFEPDAQRDAYLKSLVAACHRNGILVYAWLELPHVSEQFWTQHPAWREKTALLQDAHLDWRKLMNLTNRDCFQAVVEGVRNLLGRFDWDGVNLAELYFESLEGTGNPSRFTPMNDDFRRLFREAQGFDPIEVFGSRTDGESRRKLLEFRSETAARMQEDWLRVLAGTGRGKPHLDLVLTHVDDRFAPGIRDAIGADAARVLPLLDRYSFTFLIEDPATVWHLGPQRYGAIADRYRALTPRREKLAVDINIVDRYQDVYPTKQQTGIELLQLVHEAAKALPRVALYLESALPRADLPLLGTAAAAVNRIEQVGSKTVVDAPQSIALRWTGGALVDGRPWPVLSDGLVWLPGGVHSVEPAPESNGPRVVDFNGDLQAARYGHTGGIELAYRSTSRAFAVLDRAPVKVIIDGLETRPELAGPATLILPRGQHLVAIQAGE